MKSPKRHYQENIKRGTKISGGQDKLICNYSQQEKEKLTRFDEYTRMLVRTEVSLRNKCDEMRLANWSCAYSPIEPNFPHTLSVKHESSSEGSSKTTKSKTNERREKKHSYYESSKGSSIRSNSEENLNALVQCIALHTLMCADEQIIVTMNADLKTTKIQIKINTPDGKTPSKAKSLKPMVINIFLKRLL